MILTKTYFFFTTPEPFQMIPIRSTLYRSVGSLKVLHFPQSSVFNKFHVNNVEVKTVFQ